MAEDQLPEAEKPQEIIKPVDFGEKKENLLVSKFKRSREKFGRMASGIRQAFGGVKSQSGEIDLGPEARELDALSQGLASLDSSTGSLLGLQQESETEPSKDQGIKRVGEKLHELQERDKSARDEGMFRVVGMLGDGDKIEGHQIDLVDQGDKTAVYLKTTSQMTERLKNEVIPSLAKQVSDGTYEFEIRGKDGRIAGSDAWVIKIDENTTAYVGKGVASIDGYANEMYAFKGPIKIEISGIKDTKLIAQSVESAFQKLQIPDALTAPEEQSELDYKEAQYREHHKLNGDQWNETQKTELMKHLKRQEAFPGYYPVIDEGASQRYQKDGEFFLTHSVAFSPSSSVDNIIPVLQQGLLSEHERLKRGKSAYDPNDPDNKYSSIASLAGGRAENVFLRAISSSSDEVALGRIAILIDPQVLDRTDWHGFLENPSWRGPEPFRFSSPPKDFFTNIHQDPYGSSEIAMSRGISPKMIKGVIVRNKEDKKSLVETLKKSGMEKVHGVPVDAFIKVYKNFGELKADSSS